MANFNTARLAEDIKREISTAMRDIKDSAVAKAMVGVSRCELTSDLSYCKRVKMRKLPQLIFVPDNSMDYYEHISEVISKLPKPADTGDNGDDER